MYYWKPLVIGITFPQVGYRNRGIGATINSRDTLVAFSVYTGLPRGWMVWYRAVINGIIYHNARRVGGGGSTNAAVYALRVTQASSQAGRYAGTYAE